MKLVYEMAVLKVSQSIEHVFTKLAEFLERKPKAFTFIRVRNGNMVDNVFELFRTALR